MSKTVDERVVEMRFDNANFEKNVQTSMSTLDKLKRSLNLSGASKGLENIGEAAKKVRFDGMIEGIETVNARFSYLQGAIQHQINNIVDTCVGAWKKIVSALTINPVKDGFAEYETQINAVQTILANTQKEGTNVKIVNNALDELNRYADKTIYNFTEMTRNIGTFTAAGVKLDTSVSAIQGIANLAAVSGSTSQQASTAMYQLSQAIASGTVKLMDWNSVVNAGMGGQVFQDALVRTSEHLQTGAKAAIAAEGSFRESLSTGWLTTEVLTETLDQFSTAAESQQEYEAAVKKFLDQGYTQEEAKQMADMARTAGEAATKVKTFSQLIDTLKEALGSGWTESWRIIIGDFEEAKALWTSISDVISNFINKSSEARNALLKSAMGKSFSDLSKKITGIVEPAKKAADTVQKVSTTITDLGSVVDDVIIGKFGNGQERFDALTKSGKNYYEIQNKVNEKLGDSFRYTQEQIDAQNKLLGSQNAAVKSTEDAAAATINLTDEQKNQIKAMIKLSDAELKAKGYTEEQIKAFDELRKTANKLGIPIDSFIDQLDQINGRWLLIDSFKNVGRALVKVFSSLTQGAREIFGVLKADTVFNLIAAFHKLTSSLILSDENADKLKRTFKGLFAAIDLIRAIATGGASLAIRIFAKALGAADVNVLDFTSRIGDAIVKFHDFLLNNKLVNAAVELLGKGFEKVGEIIGKVIKLLTNNPITKEIASVWDKLFGADTKDGKGIIDMLYQLSDAMGISKEKGANLQSVMDGLNSALNLSNWKWSASLTSGLKLLDAVLGLFGTDLAHVAGEMAKYVTGVAKWIEAHTPFVSMSSKIAKGLTAILKGLQGCVDSFLQLEQVQKIIQKFKDTITELFGDVNKGFESVGIDSFCKKIEDAFNRLNEWIKGIKNTDEVGKYIVEGIANGITSGIKNAIAAISKIATVIMDTFCELLGIHSPSKWGYEQGKFIVIGIVNGIKDAIKFIKNSAIELANSIKKSFEGADIGSKLDVIVSGLSKALTRLKDILVGFDFKYLLTLIPIGIALVMVKNLFGLIDTLSDGISSINGVLNGFTAIEKSLAGLIGAYQKDIKSKALRNIALSVGILAASVVALAYVPADKLDGAVATIIILAGVLTGLVFAMNKLETASVSLGENSVNLSGLKTGIVAIGTTLLMLAATLKIMGSMNPDELKQGFIGLAGAVAAIGVLIIAIGAVGKLGDISSIDKVASMMIALSASLLIMSVAIKQIASMSVSDLAKGAGFVAGMVVFISTLTVISTFAGSEISKMGTMMIKMSVALGLMVGVVKLIGLLHAEEIIKGVIFAAGFLEFTGALVLISKMFPEAQIAKVGGLVMSISVAMMLMVGVCKLVGMLSVEDMLKGAAFAAGFLVFIGALVAVTKISSTEKIAKVSATILAMSIAVGALAAVSVIMGLVDTKALIKGVAAVSALGLVMTAMIWATRGAESVKANIVAMTVAIAVMAGAVAALCLIDSTKLKESTGALVILMSAFAVMEKMSKSAKGAWKSIILLTATVAALAGVLKLMDMMKVGNAVQNAVGLGTLLVSMSASLAILSVVNEISTTALAGIAVMTLVVAGLAVIFGIMDHFNINPSIETATALSILLVAMSGVTAILSVIGPASNLAVAGAIGLIGVVSVIGSFIGMLGYINDQFPQVETFLNKGIPLLKAIGTGIGEFVGSIASGFMDGVLNILPEFGQSLSDFMKKADGFINGASNISGDVLAGIGNLSAAIVLLSAADFISGISSFLQFGSSFADLGTDLSTFMTNASGFLTGITSVDAGSVKSAKILSETVVALTTADFISGISAFLGLGTTNFTTLGTQLESFGEAMVKFSETVSGKINTDAITAASDAGKIMVKLQSSLPETGGWIQRIAGTSDLAAFGESCKSFGEAIVDFSNSVSGKINADAITAASEAGKLMVELEKSLPKQGSWLQNIVGKQDLATFGGACQAFGEAITAFSSSVSVNASTVEQAVNAGKAMAELQKAIPTKKLFDGKVSLSTFGEKISAFGDGLASFANSIGDVNFSNVETAVTQANALKKLAKELVDLDTSGIENFGDIVTIGKTINSFSNKVSGISTEAVSTSVSAAMKLKNLISGLVGIDTSGIESFKVDKIGMYLQSYSAKVSKVDLATVLASIVSARSLASFIRSLSGMDTSGVNTFSTALTTLGNVSIDNFVNTFTSAGPRVTAAMNSMMTSLSVSVIANSIIITQAFNTMMSTVLVAITSRQAAFTVAGSSLMNGLRVGFLTGLVSIPASTAVVMTAAVAVVNSRRGLFATAGSGLMTSLRTGISSGSNGVTSIVNTTVSRAKTIVDGKRSQFNQSGRSLMTNLCNGLRSGGSGATSAIYSALNGCSGAIRSFYYSFYSAGGYLGDGLTEGIASRESAAYRAGYRLGQKAVQGEKDGQQSHSPSKLTQKAGKWLGEGLVIGMDKMGKAVYKSGKSMGTNAVQSISSALSMIGNTDISDTSYTPTIQPVVDMAELQNGSHTLSIGADLSARLLSQPVTTLQDMLNSAQDSINASNNEVINAINELRADLNAFYSDDEKEIALYMNSKKVASTLAKDMNRQLAVLQKRGAY